MTTFTSHPDGTPCWVDIMVQNEEQHHDLRAFLSTLYDWTWEGGAAENGGYSLALLDGAPVMGMGYDENTRGVTTTYFSTSDLDASLARASELGASVTVPSMDVMGLGKMALLIDPTGASYGLWEPGTFHGFGVAHVPNAPGWFNHDSSDPETAGAFYQEVLGHTLTSMEGDMRILQNGDAWFASISRAQNGMGPTWSPIYVVDSLKRVHETVPRHGGAIILEEMPVPGSAVCVFSEPVNGTLMTVMRAGEQPD